MSADSYSSPVPTAPEPEVDPQASLVADSFLTTAQAYFEFSDRLSELGAEGASADELQEVRAKASALAARAAQVSREAKMGWAEHEGHGCLYEEAYAGIAEFLGVLLESSAGLLEISGIDQVDGGQLAHPFAHFVPLLASDVGGWLEENACPEERELLASFTDKVNETVMSAVGAAVSLSFGPVSAADFAAFKEWSEGGAPEETETELDEPFAEALRQEVLALREGLAEHDHPHLFRIGQVEEDVVLIDGDFAPGMLWPLLDVLEENDVSFRLVDWYTMNEGALVTVGSWDLPERLTRRAFFDEDGALCYQLDEIELDLLREGDADLDDITAYLSEDLFPGQGYDAEMLARLATLVGRDHSE